MATGIYAARNTKTGQIHVKSGDDGGRKFWVRRGGHEHATTFAGAKPDTLDSWLNNEFLAELIDELVPAESRYLGKGFQAVTQAEIRDAVKKYRYEDKGEST